MESKRNPGLDLLKAIMVLFVFLHHTTVFRIWPASDISQMNFLKILYQDILTIAVPAFMVISLYLYVLKRTSSNEGRAYFLRRVKRLGQILLFWVAVYLPVVLLTGYTTYFEMTSSILNKIVGVIFLPFLDGGLYFLGGVFAQVILIEGYLWILGKMPSKKSKSSFLMGLFTVCSLLSVLILGCGSSLPELLIRATIFGPILFLPYGPALLLCFESGMKKTLLFSSLVAVASTILLWTLPDGLTQAPVSFWIKYLGFSHNSPCMLFFALALLSIFVKKKSPNSRIVDVTARYALGIYLVHPLVIAIFERFREVGGFAFLWRGHTFLFLWAFPLGVLLATVLILWIMQKIGLGKYVS